MWSFFTVALQDSAFDGFSHFLRLDSDAVFLRPVPYDIFSEVSDGGFLTAYSMLGMPEIHPPGAFPERSRLLLEPVYAHLLRLGVLPPPDMVASGNQGLADTLWSGPLQLSALSLYRNNDFVRFMEMIDIWKLTASGVREQATHTLWLKLAVPRMKALWLCDLDMQHKIRFASRCARVQC